MFMLNRKAHTMNILDRMETRLEENKTAFKTYATAKAAAKAVEKKIAEVADFNGLPADIDYMTILIPSVGRYAVMVNYSEWMRKYSIGGYVGAFAVSGFWSQ